MHKSLLKLLGFVVALALSATASALGLGGINVVSALGQPLKADIELVSVGKAEKASLVARLASSDAYKGAGLEYPYGNKFKFQVEHRADGSYLVVSSGQPVNDPFVSLLVELTWSSGKLLREYTFLLDPPDYIAEQPAPAEVVAVAPVAPAAPAAVEAVEPAAAPEAAPAAAEQGDMGQPSPQQEAEELKKQPETMRAETPSDEKVLAKQPAPARKPVEKAVPAGEVVVKRGDTLNLIAAENKPVDVSLERMLVAMYRANAAQFDGKNMNRIKTGKILRLPAQEELMGVSQTEAAKEIRAQAADWNAYRQKLASAAPMSSQGQDAQQVSSGKISSSVTDKAPVAKDSAKEVLKLSKGEAPGDQVAGGGKALTAQDKKNAAQEEAIAKAKAMEEEKTRLAMLEQNLKDMQRLAELKSQAAALAQSASAAGAASEVAAASDVAAASAVEAASEVAAASAPVAQPKPKAVAPKVVEPEPTLVDEILGNPIYLAGGAAVLAALGGLGYVVQRRRKSPVAAFSEKQDEVGEITGRMATPQAPSPDTGDFTALSAQSADEAAPQSDDVDPISEADLFLNFGRDAQAEEVLKEALLRTPDDHRIHLKLLGIYANRVDVNSFATIARQLQISGDEPAWEQAAAMGRKLEPNNPLYGGPSIEDAASATMQTTVLNTAPEIAAEETSLPSVDFDLGEGDAAKTMILSPEEMPAAQEVAMDFDLTSTSPMQAAAPDMDFDVTSTHPSIPAMTEEAAAVPEEPAESGLPSLDDLVFDVTSTHPSMPAVEPEEPKKIEHDDADVMEFSLDFPVEEVAAKPAAAAPAADIGLSGISLNLDDVGTTEEVVKDERWHEVATKLDLARAYQEMGDQTGAREILEEVLRDGDEEQQAAAQALIDQLI